MMIKAYFDIKKKLIFKFFLLFILNLFQINKSMSATQNKTEDILKKIVNLKKYNKTVSGFNVRENIKIQKQIESLEKNIGLLNASSNLTNSKKYLFFFILENLPIIFWQLSLLFFWFLFLIFILFKIIKLYFFLQIFIGLLFISSMIGLKYSLNEQKPIGIIFAQANLYSGPDKCFPIISSLKQGSSFKILEEAEAFAKIKLQKNIGWILKTDLIKIE